MKHLTKLFFILFIFILSESIYAQNIDSTFTFAEKQYANEDYQGATETYERIIFFDSSQRFSNQIYLKLAECLYRQKRFEEAARQYEKAYFSTEKDSLKNHILFQKASCFMLEKNYASALVELYNLPDSLDLNAANKKELFLGMVSFAMNDFESSQIAFNSYIQHDSLKKNKLELLFKKNEKISKLSPKKAKLLSTFLPGLGQFYAGDIKNGLNSILLTGGLMTWAIRIAMKTTFLDAALTVIPWFQRYYVGGYNRAESIAENMIKRRRNQVYNQILDVVSK